MSLSGSARLSTRFSVIFRGATSAEIGMGIAQNCSKLLEIGMGIAATKMWQLLVIGRPADKKELRAQNNAFIGSSTVSVLSFPD